VSRAGLAPLSQSFDHIGPLARTAEDAELILAAIAGRDAADPTSLADPYGTQPAEIAGMRIGIDPRWCRERIDRSVAAALREAEEVFRELGATIVEVDFPSTEAVMSAGLALMLAEQVMNHRETWPSRRADYGPALAANLDAAPMLTIEAVTLAGLVRDDFRGSVAAMFAEVDLFLCPVMPIAVPSLTHLRTLLDDMMHFGDRVARYTIPFDASGSPAISLPAGFDEAGLPSSIQLVGPMREDARVLAAGKAFQSVTGWHLRRPAVAI
jgi:amidase